MPLPAWLDLSGTVALVTGAGSEQGIGIAAARMLGDLGATVHITATGSHVLERAEELARLGYAATGHVADLTDESQVQALVAEVTATSGAPLVVVSNAGMTSGGIVTNPGSVADIDYPNWQASIARNLDTAFLVAKHTQQSMIDAGWGRIINVASITGPVMAMAGQAAYAAAKAGMVGLTRAMAVDLGSHGVTVNAVAPGWIATGAQEEPEARQGESVPVGRSGTPDQVGSAIAWLASPAAGYVTGQCVIVDGGNTIAEERMLPGDRV